MVRAFLADIPDALGQPEVLCLKNPLLSQLFYWVHHLMGNQVRFVTVVRHRADIVRSSREVMKKPKQDFSPATARVVAAEVNSTYAHLDVDGMQDVMLSLRHDDLVRPDALNAPRHVTGLHDIAPDRLWADRVDFVDPSRQDAWHPPKYFGPISFESRLQPLEAELRDIVDEVCGLRCSVSAMRPTAW